jgi:hypothetical protein
MIRVLFLPNQLVEAYCYEQGGRTSGVVFMGDPSDETADKTPFKAVLLKDVNDYDSYVELLKDPDFVEDMLEAVEDQTMVRKIPEKYRHNGLPASILCEISNMICYRGFDFVIST